MEGGSPDQESVVSGTKKSSISSGGRIRDEFLHRFIDSQTLTSNLEDWFQALSENSFDFDVPFELIDLQKFDYALEGVSFQQLIRMPSGGGYTSSPPTTMDPTAFLAIEDFLHASIKGLWEAFWDPHEPIPLNVASLYNSNLKFYQAEKAIANGKLSGLCATSVMLNNPRHPHGKWHDILELALLRPGIGTLENDSEITYPSLSILGEALFYGVRVLLSRSLRRSKGLNSVFVILADCQYGGVVKLEGDLTKMEFDVNNVYECASEWIKNHSQVSVSPFDRIWNKLGNANWGDIGALQVLFATFQSMVQYAGPPKNSIEDLAADHSSRLQTRRNERRMGEIGINGNNNGLFKLQQRSVSPEIVEVPEESGNIEPRRSVTLEVGSILMVEDSNWQKSYKINEVLSDGDMSYYFVNSVDDPGKALFLYVGSHPSQVEPAWEDMKLWYQVQRQTKVFSVMNQNGLSSKYLPQLTMSGKIVHPGACRKQNSNSGGNCDDPWCGTPILVTTPVGKTVAEMVRSGEFGADEAIKCCHDCLSALSTAATAGIRHGDIRPENIICVNSGGGQNQYFVLVGWGHAILEERDRPALNLHFSSTYALQEGKLCSASDAESLVYLLYFSSGGDLPELDSVEGALEWRDTFWSKRLIQQNLGEISAVLKAFADYVDSLCGTPYPMDYEIWLRRLKRHLNENGKEINTSS
ncbi:uncharacterized protein LOC111879352 [Lactuca sativa]|uniref:Protein kinase domain-containing protein n=1 Tax=Lactuca sativa TaxID=4236 RepID=A0A9R1UD08_LACSA|nr:uncharacterized protein LOC111879352 [Lactuca sativa]KAJ0184897.1 hypothetical protein LSAT_V11C900467360 [Lactuca sativa]